MDTKREILSMARRLFTEHGYNGVSMRDIAGELNISVGNLTYHFKKKEELIEAIVQDMQKSYQPRTAPQTLYELDNLISHIQELQELYAFYFSHRTQLAEISDKIKKIQLRMLKENDILWKNTFDNLRLAGLINNEEYPHQHEHLMKAVQMVTIYWSEHSKLETGSGDGTVELKQCVWAIIIPILSPDSRLSFNNFSDLQFQAQR
ncbi:TetR/AcrR family transcriptional regulator [Desulfosporosinus hippei]|uniref:DNA-binding transcriptional regulator, AcrR family n=1 Tax=Desulfosporosinus hippei DSM 8344 TaxID=1121419 RepID=A0A1G8CVK3_9FIRM|nr:TetR/AcrR family transcriptional regulator [Desulfosporosinus hippei]SDH49209.1 DNA-binding transcriptional regulator, AcrR family [Desulfosporosinus hippei DSM 8344]